MTGEIALREEVRAPDVDRVREITESTGFFFPEEIDTAVELVEERLSKGLRSGYYFLFADRGGRTLGYSCYGPVACTKSSFDIYWIAVDVAARNEKLGTRLLEESERKIKELGGTRIYVETSSRALYEPTRAFYLKRGYKEEARLEDFYGPNDAKVIYLKKV
jgi:ribosomal protein S18 acetylase RimI-like enzyme